MSRKADNVLAEHRKNRIVEMINLQGAVTINQLCEKFHVTPVTIRSDLSKLEEAGALRRTYGGAVRVSANAQEGVNEGVYLGQAQQLAQKRAIAQAARRYIQPGDVIALDTGSTTYGLCKLLGDIERLTVITCDLQIATWLEYNTDVSIIMVGGLIRRHYHCTFGQTARNTLSMLNVEKLFLASNGVSLEQGISTISMEMAEIKSAMAASSDKIILLTDSSKIGRKTVCSFMPLSDVDILITDSGADAGFVQQAQTLGVRVVTVHADDSDTSPDSQSDDVKAKS